MDVELSELAGRLMRIIQVSALAATAAAVLIAGGWAIFIAMPSRSEGEYATGGPILWFLGAIGSAALQVYAAQRRRPSTRSPLRGIVRFLLLAGSTGVLLYPAFASMDAALYHG